MGLGPEEYEFRGPIPYNSPPLICAQLLRTNQGQSSGGSGLPRILTVDCQMIRMPINAILKGAPCQAVTFSSNYELPVCEPSDGLWIEPTRVGVIWRDRRGFPASFALNALVPINTTSWFLTPLFTFSPLEFSLCRAPFLSVVFLSVHSPAQIISP